MSIAHRIKVAREAAGMTQAALAKASTVSPAVISGYEGHSYKPRRATTEKLAKALGTTVEFLEKGTGGLGSGASSEEAAPTTSKTVPQVLADARDEIAAVLGVPVNKVKLEMTLAG